MGKGSNPGGNTAVKQARAVNTGTEGAGINVDESGNVCLFQFTERLLLGVANGIAAGDEVAIVPKASDSSKLDIYIGASPVGVYDGQYVDRIMACIGENYAYRGTVNDVRIMGRGFEVGVTVTGHVYE